MVYLDPKIIRLETIFEQVSLVLPCREHVHIHTVKEPCPSFQQSWVGCLFHCCTTNETKSCRH